MNGRFLSVNRLYYSNKQFCSIFKILLFSNGHESNQIENKMPNLVQEYAYHTDRFSLYENVRSFNERYPWSVRNASLLTDQATVHR